MNKYQLMIRQIDVKPSDEDMVIEGYAAVYDSPTVLWTDEDGTQYKEVIERGAFSAADLSNVVLRYNHSPEGMVLARTTNGTLQVTPDQNGLKIRAKLAPTTAGKDLYALIKRGDVNKMSFGGYSQDVDYDLDNHMRHIKTMRNLFDVSAVDFPAYEATSLAAVQRSFEEARKTEQNLIEERMRIQIAALF